MCTVYCLHATKGPWFLVDMSHFLDRKPRIIFPTFLLLDSVMERLFINLKSKLGSIDRRRSLLRCIINHCQRKPCVGNAIATKLPLQISSHRLFQLFGPARLSWPPFFSSFWMYSIYKSRSTSREYDHESYIHLNSFHLQKNNQFPIWTFFLILHHFPKKTTNNLTFRAHHHSPSIPHHPSPSWGYWIRMDQSLSPWIFGIHPPIDASAKRSEWREELKNVLEKKTGVLPLKKPSEHTTNLPECFFQVGFSGWFFWGFIKGLELIWSLDLWWGFQVSWKDDGSSFPWYD